VKPVNLRSHFMLRNMITLSSEQSWASKIISQYLRNAKSIWVWEEPCVSRSIHRLNLLMSATHKRLFIGSYNKLIGRLTNSCWKELYLEFKIKWHELPFHEQEIVRKGRSARTLKREESLPSLPRKKKTSSKTKKKKTVKSRRYVSEQGHIVVPPPEEEGNSHELRMTGPEVIQALGGPSASFSGVSRRQAREINPGLQLREKPSNPSLDLTRQEHALFSPNAREDWRIPEKFRDRIFAFGGDPTIFRRCPIWMWDMYPDAHHDDGQLFELYQLAFLHYYEEISTGVEINQDESDSSYSHIWENFSNYQQGNLDRKSDPNYGPHS